MKCINKECEHRCEHYIDENKVPIGTTVLDITGDGTDCLVYKQKQLIEKKLIK